MIMQVYCQSNESISILTRIFQEIRPDFEYMPIEWSLWAQCSIWRVMPNGASYPINESATPDCSSPRDPIGAPANQNGKSWRNDSATRNWCIFCRWRYVDSEVL